MTTTAPDYRETITTVDGTTTEGTCSTAHALGLLRTAVRRRYQIEATRHGGVTVTRKVPRSTSGKPGTHTVMLTPGVAAVALSRTTQIDLTLISRGAWLTASGRINAGYLHSIPLAASVRLIGRGLAVVGADGAVTVSLTARLAMIGQGHSEEDTAVMLAGLLAP